MPARTAALLLLVLASNVAGNFALSYGMKRVTGSPLAALLNPYVLAGVLVLIVWTVARMSLLSRADLSYVLPVTAIGYVGNVLAGRWLLGESVTPERWAGAALIAAGAILTGSTAPGARRE